MLNLQHVQHLPQITLPLTKVRNKNAVHARGGLNWGHRPEYNRNPNEAYIPVPKKMHNAHPGFLPALKVPFTVYTDDGQKFTFVVAQQKNKALETKDDNSLLGKYFRQRLGVASGAFVTIDDLIRYGRRDVTLYKINDTEFFLDFHV